MDSSVSKTNLRHKNCANCSKRLDVLKKKNVNRVTNENLIKKLNSNKSPTRHITSGSLVCSKCLSKMYRKSVLIQDELPVYYEHSTVEVDQPQEGHSQHSYLSQTPIETSLVHSIEDQKTTESITLNLPRTKGSHTSCVICNMKDNFRRLKHVPKRAIADAFFKTGIVIPLGCRCCLTHLNDIRLFNEIALSTISSFSSNVTMNHEQLETMFEELRSAGKRECLFLQFRDLSCFTDDTCYKITGFTKKEFTTIHNCLETMRNSIERSRTQALAVYLFWLKTGLNQSTTASFFGTISQQDVSRFCDQVRNALTVELVPHNIGANHLTRSEWLREFNIVAKQLYSSDDDSRLIIVADGTYCFCEKSSNNEFQRLSYSTHKKKHLLKPFVICTSNGYIVDIYGFFEATKNDASILIEVIKSDDLLKNLLKENDILLLDRGFRDCIEQLKSEYKLDPKMPFFTDGKQPSTYEANCTRFLTKTRWVVEATIGFLKRSFRALDNVQNKELKHLMKDYKIAGSFVNMFFKRLESDKTNHETIVKNMKDKLLIENELEPIVDEFELHKKSKFIKLDEVDIKDFPRLEIETIQNNISLGTYQLKMCFSYLAEAFRSGEKIFINDTIFDTDKTKIIFSIIRSRHSKATKYKVYVRYQPLVKDIEGIMSWYCTCLAGIRTVGCCVHIMSVVFYFSHGRYLAELPDPAKDLRSIIVRNDSSSDEEFKSNPLSTNNSFSDSSKRKKTIIKKTKDNNLSGSNSSSKKTIKKKKTQESSDEESNETKDDENYNKDVTKLQDKPPNLAHDSPPNQLSSMPSDILKSFLYNVPSWGGRITTNIQSQPCSILIQDTCTIDYFLYFVWIVFKLLGPNAFKVYTDDIARQLEVVSELIDKGKWMEAKKVWIIDVCKISPERTRRSYRISTFGTEFEFYIIYVRALQAMTQTDTCSNSNCSEIVSCVVEDIFFNYQNNNIIYSCFSSHSCRKCSSPTTCTIDFQNDPSFLVVESELNSNVHVHNLDLELIISNKYFKLIGATFHRVNHFISVFRFNEVFYLIDDLKPNNTTESIPNHKVSTAFYLRK